MIQLLLCTLLLAALPIAASAQSSKKKTAQKQTEQPAPKRHRGTDTVGVINGEVLMLRDFKSVLSEIIRSAASDSIVSEENWTVYVNAAWEECLKAVLVQQEILKRGLGLSNAQVKAALVKNPPEFLASQFVDSTGAFRPDILEWALNDPSQDSVVQIVVSAHRMKLEDEALRNSIAPNAKSEAEREGQFQAWLTDQKRRARVIDNRLRFGYY